MRPSPAVLLTDFGLRDPFVGIVKGVILAHAPKAPLVDLGHELAPQDLDGAALALRAAVPYFPNGSLFVVVVDPGVGSSRRILWTRSRRHQFLVPDNGVLSWLPEDEAPVVWRDARNPAWFLPPVGATFHGRDRFAPLAAALLNGVSPATLGPRVHDPVRRPWPEPRAAGGGLSGVILSFDRFGNAVTNVPSRAVPAGARLVHKGRDLGPLRSYYSEVPRGRALAVAGSSGLVELSTREGDFRARTRARPGDPVHVRRRR
ncbi:MAG: SAM-dependent chlorinase/fluorinase [Elusimicrobia bacterium]|nr:SAM-dependent chlorinase/fluorinase [Elusimicrobiota bacterium]